MKTVECRFEPDVLVAVVQGRWPIRADRELVQHATTCQICSDIAAVAGVIEESRDSLRAAASLPDPGRVWWVAQMRARREAAAAANRPITAAHLLAVACAMGLLGACFGATSDWFRATLQTLTAQTDPGGFWSSVMASVATHGLLVAALAGLVLLVPVVVYLVVAEE